MTYIATYHTGDLPIEAILTHRNVFGEELSWSDSTALWAGCIDAPGNFPAGSHVSAPIDDDEYCATSRYVPRAN